MGSIMKAVICLLFPVLLFAQNPFPGSLVLTNGRTYTCLITSVSDSKVEIIYLNNRTESIVLIAVDQLSINELGIVYSASQGFTKDVDKIKDFVDDRMEKIAEEQLVQRELAKLTAASNSEQFGKVDNTGLTGYFESQKPFQMKTWSFGVLLIPYYSGTRYRVIHYIGQYPPQVITQSYAENEINMESQLSFGITPNIKLIFDAVYSSTFNELRYEYHSRSEFNEYDSGLLSTSGLDIIDFSIGAKYYFIDFIPNNVSIYAIAGFGKQFAFAEVKDENLFPEPGPTPIIEDNYEDYVEGLNSPWHFNFGFGAEYLFNESLSLNTNIRFIYSTVSSDYDYRFISEFETNTQTIEYSSSEFITRIGLGINFYF